jgi:hypothetical protein
MIENKKNKFMNIVYEVLNFISKIISVSIFPSIEEGTERIMRNIEDRIMIIKRRIIMQIYFILISCFGLVFLIFAIFFFMKEYLAWNNTISFLSIGITIFIISLILKIKESNRR